MKAGRHIQRTCANCVREFLDTANPSMSALCQKRTSRYSFDYLVSYLLQVQRDVDAECLGGAGQRGGRTLVTLSTSDQQRPERCRPFQFVGDKRPRRLGFELVGQARQATQRAPRAAACMSSPAGLREWRSGICRQKFRPRRSRRPARRGRAPCRDW